MVKSNLVFLVMFSLVFSFLIFPFYESAYAYTNSHTVSVNSRQVEFGPAIISIDYDVYVDVERPSELDPGDRFTVTVSPKSGKLTFHIEVLGKTYSIPKTLNLGDEISFNIAPGIDAYVSTSATSTANIGGPVSNTMQTLRWDYPSSQIIRSSVLSDVGRPGNVEIMIPMKINLDAGLNLNILGLIKQNLGERNLGTINAYPTIHEEISINRPTVGFSGFGNMTGAIMIVIFMLVIIIIVTSIAVAVKRRKHKNKSQMSPISPTPTFTYDTVKEIQKSPEKKSDTTVKETIIDSKAYWAYPINVKRGDKLIGEISANGNFVVYLTDREHFKKFQEKKKRDKMEFYQGGRSEGFRYNISYVIPHDGEFLLAILNEGKSAINVKLDYFVSNVD